MKWTLILLSMLAACGAKAQTDTNAYTTVLVTNWVKPGPYLRVVNGVTYNVAYSKLWSKFSTQEGLGHFSMDMDDSGDSLCLAASVHEVNGSTAFFDIIQERFAHETYTGALYQKGKQFDHAAVVLNCDNPSQMGVDFYCMKTTNYINSKGVLFPAYDCGVQATNLVPVVKSVKMKLNRADNLNTISSNAISQ